MSDKDAQSISRGERSNLLARNAANGVVEGVASILDEERGETDVSERSRARTSTSRGCLASVALMACAVGAGMAVASRGGVDDARTSARARGGGKSTLGISGATRARGGGKSTLGISGATGVRTYIIADTSPGDEMERSRKGRDYVFNLFKTHGGLSDAEARNTVEISSATFPSLWPDTFETARSATHDVLAGALAASEANVPTSELPYPIRQVHESQLNPQHRCVGEKCVFPYNHHLGCLLSHMSVWKKAISRGEDRFAVWEQDGMGIASVSPLDYTELGRQLPRDADMVWLLNPGRSTGQFVKKFRSRAFGTWGKGTRGLVKTDWSPESMHTAMNSTHVYLYKWNKMCSWAGTAALMLTKQGVEKLLRYSTEHSLDMIDAFLTGGCIHKSGKTSRLSLNCYHASSVPTKKELLGGIVPDWYTDETVGDRALPQEQVDAMDRDDAKFNSLGCQRGGDEFKSKSAWIPTSWAGDDSADSCVPSWNAPVDVCDASVKYPLDGHKYSYLGSAMLRTKPER